MTIIANQEEMTPAVLKVMEQTSDPRPREIIVSLISHLHAFVRDVRLSETEFQLATRILNSMGQQSNDRHNEFVLMAGSLGVSSLVCLLNNGDCGTTETTQSLLGPFWRLNHPMKENGGSILRSGTPGPRRYGQFRFADKAGEPIEGLEVDIWHASPVGLYEKAVRKPGRIQSSRQVQDRHRRARGLQVRQAHRLPDPNRHDRRRAHRGAEPPSLPPAHVHVLAHKPGLKTLISQIYVDETDYLTSDVRFGVTEALVGHLERHDGPDPEDGDVGEWFWLDHTLVLEPGESKLQIPPIK